MLSFVICIRGCCVGGGAVGVMVLVLCLCLCLRWFWYALSSDDGWTDGRLHSSPVEKQKSVDKIKQKDKMQYSILCVYVNAVVIV